MSIDKVGIIHGRFQGLHLGHMEYLLAGKARCEHLIIGITNFDPTEQKQADQANPYRIEDQANPFSYYDRYCMILRSMIEAGVNREEFDIVPFPIENPDRIQNYVPMDAVFYMTIYDKWGERKKAILQELGVNVTIMWRRSDVERLTSGTEIRKLIRLGKEEWKSLVPNAVYRYITENNLKSKLKE